jgi:hypothetical protein
MKIQVRAEKTNSYSTEPGAVESDEDNVEERVLRGCGMALLKGSARSAWIKAVAPELSCRSYTAGDINSCLH